MTAHSPLLDDDNFAALPRWAGGKSATSEADLAFQAGAALCHLHHCLTRGALPQMLLRERLALRAAEADLIRAGRVERAADLRDAVQFLRPGDQAGPAGEIYLAWRQAVLMPVKNVHRGEGGPVMRAAALLSASLDADPRGETAALIAADAVLAKALGWSHLVPLLGLGLSRRDLRQDADALRLACFRAIVSIIPDLAIMAADLTRRGEALLRVAPKLRAKGSDDAVALFLSRDAVTPGALHMLRSPRAARRFCDRLVELGVAQELTGRDTFRLFGL